VANEENVAIAESQGNATAVVDRTETADRPPESVEEIEARFWRAVDRIGELNKDEDPDEVLAFVTEVVEEVRQERYEREQRATDGSR